MESQVVKNHTLLDLYAGDHLEILGALLSGSSQESGIRVEGLGLEPAISSPV